MLSAIGPTLRSFVFSPEVRERAICLVAEMNNRLDKAEVIHHLRPWMGIENVEYTTLKWVAWYNT
jgi:hypothetical protein